MITHAFAERAKVKTVTSIEAEGRVGGWKLHGVRAETAGTWSLSAGKLVLDLPRRQRMRFVVPLSEPSDLV